MFRPTTRLWLVTGLASTAVWAGNQPFVGEWKRNPSNSKLTDQMKVDRVADDKYAFDFGGGSAETIAPDGTDQPGLAGTTLSVTMENTLSSDGKTLTMTVHVAGRTAPSILVFERQ